MAVKTIRYRYDYNSLFGSFNLEEGNVDEQASIERYDDLLTQALADAFPDAEIEVDHHSLDRKVETTGWDQPTWDPQDIGDAVEIDADMIARDVWEGFEWVIERG